MAVRLSALERKALRVAPTLRADGLFTCTMLGEALFAEKRFREWNVYPTDMQRFARPAGKIVAALRRAGLVEATFNVRDDSRCFYRVTKL